MNSEILKKANELDKEITSIKQTISALESPYVSSIRATNYRGEKEITEVCISQNDEVLHDLIVNHFKDKLNKLQMEFDSL